MTIATQRKQYRQKSAPSIEEGIEEATASDACPNLEEENARLNARSDKNLNKFARDSARKKANLIKKRIKSQKSKKSKKNKKP